MFKLTEYKGKDSPIESSFDPGQGLYVIGRDSRSNKVLNSQYISRIHCQLVSSGEDWILYDGNPNEAGWLNKAAAISINGVGRKTISMLPGTTVNLISAHDYRATLERERENKIITAGINRDTIDMQTFTPGRMIEILNNFIEELKDVMIPIVAESRDVGEKLAKESEERKESDRLSKRDFEAFKKPVMYATGAVLLISLINIFNGDKEIIGKILDIVAALITSGVLVKFVSKSK